MGALALEGVGLSLEQIRAKVIEKSGSGGVSPAGHIPFTKRAKKVLELSLREALQLHHNYIGTEHILLGLIREGEGVAAQVLVSLGADLKGVRAQVISVLQGYGRVAAEGGGFGTVASHAPEARPQAITGPVCPKCSTDLDDSAAYKILDVPEHEGEGKATVLFLYCKVCGEMLDDIILPDER